jgi:hypothetical protein
MSAFVVEIEYENLDDQKSNTIIGPFRTHETAAAYADSLGKAAGLMQPNPDIPGYWYGSDDSDLSVTIMVRLAFAPRVRSHAKSIRSYLRGEA